MKKEQKEDTIISESQRSNFRTNQQNQPKVEERLRLYNEKLRYKKQLLKREYDKETDKQLAKPLINQQSEVIVSQMNVNLSGLTSIINIENS